MSQIVAVHRLQAKAREKLGAGIWWATERALQQSTAWQISRLKARLIPPGPIVDLCCGIGGDSLSLAQRGPLVAVDADPMMAQMAAANLRLRSAKSAATVACDAKVFSMPEGGAVHIDPDRRVQNKRATRVEAFQPDWESVLGIVRSQKAGLVKIAPATEIDEVAGCHRAWFSLRRSVREQTLIFGESLDLAGEILGRPIADHERSAIIVDSSGGFCRFGGVPESEADVCDGPREYLLDPDPAIRAAGLTESFCRQLDASVIGSPSGFLTSDKAVVHPAVICERVIWSGSSDDRKLRRELRSRKAFPRRVKTRRVAHDANELERRYRVCGDRPITLWIGRCGNRRYAAMTEPQDSVPDDERSNPS